MNSTIKKTTLFLGACMAFQLGGIPQMLAAPSTSMEVMQQTKNKKYKVQEINLMPGQKSTLVTDGGTFSGDFLMKIGMNVFSTAHAHSKVIELTEAH